VQASLFRRNIFTGMAGSSSAAAPAEGSPYMSSRADMCRQRAAEAKQSAAQAQNPSTKRAFEEVAAGWPLLAEQIRKPPLHSEKIILKQSRIGRPC